MSYKYFIMNDNTSIDDINKQYKKLCLLFHPDKNLSATDESNVIFLQMSNEYDKIIAKLNKTNYNNNENETNNNNANNNETKTDYNNIYNNFSNISFFSHPDSFYQNLKSDLLLEMMTLYNLPLICKTSDEMKKTLTSYEKKNKIIHSSLEFFNIIKKSNNIELFLNKISAHDLKELVCKLNSNYSPIKKKKSEIINEIIKFI